MANPLSTAGKTSEFWGLLAAGIGTIAQHAGWISKETWDHIIWPVGSYVLLRATSKVVKGRAPFTHQGA